MWHGRRRSPGPSWDNTFAQREGWNPEGQQPVHVGTFESARDRLYPQEYEKVPPYGNADSPQIQEAVTTRYDAEATRPMKPVTPDARQDVLERVARPSAYGGQPQMLPLRPREGSMWNSPDMPVSDAYANLASNDDMSPEYLAEYMDEVSSVTGQEYTGVDVEDPAEFLTETGSFPAPVEETGGLYYRNAHEDKGSISAVVPEAGDLEHWPTEVERHSTNPWDRRMASFLRGRGY